MKRFVIIVDRETDDGYRGLYLWSLDGPSIGNVLNFYKKNKNDYKDVVQFIDYNTGETIKGPKYDTTTQELRKDQSIANNLAKGIKQKQPIEPSQEQPRDRFTEKLNMSELDKFKKLIKECVSEIAIENDPRAKLKESLRKVVKNVIQEISNNNTPDKKEEDKETVSKGYSKDGNQRLDKTNEKLQSELESIIHGIDSTWEAYWDDHNQLIVRAHNLLYVRIVPKFENNFDVDAMVRLVDRVRAISLTWEQVKSFVKANFGDLKKTKTDDLKKKSLDHYKDNTSGKSAGPDHDVIKNRGEKNNGEDAKIKDTKKSDKDYNEKMVKRDEDLPDQPMKQVTKPGEDPESKNKNIEKTDKVKPPKHKNDKKLKATDKKTPKFVKKQVS